VEREPRLIHVYNFRFTEYTEPLGKFRVACTKGTYVRSLAHDLGQKLGCGAHLSALRRTATDRFNISQALTLDAIEALPIPEIERRLIPVYEAAPSVAL